LEKHLGKMSEMQMGTIASQYSANAQASGLTNWTLKIGFVTHQAGNPTHLPATGSPTHAGVVTHPTDPTDSDALVKEVTPILEKYSK